MKHRKPKHADAEPIRLQKFLSQAGVCSRRKAEALMLAGRVSVNDALATELGTQIVPGRDRVAVDGQLVEHEPDPLLVVVINKPRRVITSLDDPEGRAIITDLLPKRFPRVWPVGRLDWDSEGMVMLTNDGELTHLLTHPSHHVEKSYDVKVQGLLSSSDPALEMMRRGLTLDDGFVTSGADVTVLRTTGQNTWLQVILHEGHNRQIRRMCDAVGLRVQRLRRVAVGPLELGSMHEGDWRLLTPPEVLALYSAAGAKPTRHIPTNPLAGWTPSHPSSGKKKTQNSANPKRDARGPSRKRTGKGGGRNRDDARSDNSASSRREGGRGRRNSKPQEGDKSRSKNPKQRQGRSGARAQGGGRTNARNTSGAKRSNGARGRRGRNTKR